MRFKNLGPDTVVSFAKKGEQTIQVDVLTNQVVDFPEEIGNAYGFERMDVVPEPEIVPVDSASVSSEEDGAAIVEEKRNKRKGGSEQRRTR